MKEDKIIPSLWFSAEAAEAMQFYVSVFPDSAISQNTPVLTIASLSGVAFLALNGRPDAIRPNPAISFMVTCETQAEIDASWAKLADGGKTYTALGSDPWRDYYGWVADRYGFTWQLYLGTLADVGQQRIVPTLMYCGAQQGRCGQALDFYQTLFSDFNPHGRLLYETGEYNGQVMHAQFEVGGFTMAAMDSGEAQDFTFNESVSLSLMCADQAEIDRYWEGMTRDGEEIQCGWCRDPYGVYWQVVPRHISHLMTDSPNAERAFKAMLKMKKIVISDLENA